MNHRTCGRGLPTRRGRSSHERARRIRSVRVLSAYKQGYLWMTEQVIPELKGKGAKAVHVKVAEYEPDLTKKYKFYMVPSRWVHELYPVDEIFLRDLGHREGQFSRSSSSRLRKTSTASRRPTRPARSSIAATFSPKTVEREYLDQLPGLVARASSPPAGCRRLSTARLSRTSASPPIRSASGTTTSRKCCRASTTT